MNRAKSSKGDDAKPWVYCFKTMF